MFTPTDVYALAAIHKDVYSRFTYTTDLEQYGVQEKWADIPAEILNVGAIVGDCDDFARICMLKAQLAGYPTRLLFCKVGDEGHLIAEVADRGFSQAFYFDNRFSGLVNFKEIQDYSFFFASPWNPVRGDKREWQKIVPVDVTAHLSARSQVK